MSFHKIEFINFFYSRLICYKNLQLENQTCPDFEIRFCCDFDSTFQQFNNVNESLSYSDADLNITLEDVNFDNGSLNTTMAITTTSSTTTHFTSTAQQLNNQNRSLSYTAQNFFVNDLQRSIQQLTISLVFDISITQLQLDTTSMVHSLYCYQHIKFLSG